MVEHVYEESVRLPVNLSELNAHLMHLPEDMCIEEITRLVERAEKLSVLLLQYRLLLVDVSDKEHLLSSKRLTHVVIVDAQYFIDEVDDVGPDHANLVDDD